MSKIRKDGYREKTITVGHKSDNTPIRKHVYAKKNKDAEAKRNKVKARYAMGQTDEALKVSVRDMAEAWKAIHYIGKEYKTREMYDNYVDNHILPALGHLKVVEVKPFHINDLLAIKSEHYGKSSLHKLRITLKCIFDFAADREIIQVSPVGKTKPVKIPKIKKRALSRDMVEKVRKVCEKHRGGALFMTMMCAGLRRGEALALTKNDITAAGISVTKTLEYKSNQPEVKDRPKNEASSDTVPITEELYAIIKKHMLSVGGTVLFPKVTGHGGYMTLSAFKSLKNSFFKALNVELGGVTRKKNTKVWLVPDKTTPHTLRHTYATNLYRAGVDVKTVQALMRHASIVMTMDEYTDEDEQKKLKGVKKLGKHMDKQKSKNSRIEVV